MSLSMNLTFHFHALLNKNTCIYNVSWAFQCSHRFVYAPPDSFVNLSFNWPINTLLIENEAFDKYEVAVLSVESYVKSFTHFGNDLYSEGDWECLRLSVLCRWNSYKGG